MHPRDAFPVHLVGGPAELVTGFTWWVWEREGQLARRPDTPPGRLWLTHLDRTPEKWRLHAMRPFCLVSFGREAAALYWLERERDDSPRQQPDGRYVYAYVPPEEHNHYLDDPQREDEPMDDLIAFLRARLDEDERVALDTPGIGRWGVEGYHVHDPSTPRSLGLVARFAIGYTDHIARWDPDRVLREVEAKRRLLDLHSLVHRDVYWLDKDGEEGTGEIPVCGHCVPRHSYLPHQSTGTKGPCATVRMLAGPYADHPDYREEWAA